MNSVHEIANTTGRTNQVDVTAIAMTVVGAMLQWSHESSGHEMQANAALGWG